MQMQASDLGGKIIQHSLLISLVFIALLYANTLSSLVSFGALIFFTFAIIDVIDFTAHKKEPEDTRAIIYMELALTFFIIALGVVLGTTLTTISIIMITIIFLALLVEGVFIRNIEKKLKKPEYPKQIQTVLDKGYAKVILFVTSRGLYLVSFLILFGFLLLYPNAAAVAYLSFAFFLDSLLRSDMLDTKRLIVLIGASFLIATGLNSFLSGLTLTPMLAVTLFISVLITELVFHKIKVVNLTRMGFKGRFRLG